MSDKNSKSEHATGSTYGGPLSLRTATTLFFSLLLPIAVIASLIGIFTADHPPVISEAVQQQATAMRIQRVGEVQLGAVSHVAKSGEEVFKARCSACHATGALGSPKFGDSAAWGPRIKAGFESLWNSALKGKGNMTPQSGGDLSDYEIARGLVYMANAGGAKFQEPPAPAAEADKK